MLVLLDGGVEDPETEIDLNITSKFKNLLFDKLVSHCLEETDNFIELFLKKKSALSVECTYLWIGWGSSASVSVELKRKLFTC